MLKYGVMALLLGLSFVTPAFADHMDDEIAAIAVAIVNVSNDTLLAQLHKAQKASKAVQNADKAQIKLDQAILKALQVDFKKDLKLIKKGLSPT